MKKKQKSGRWFEFIVNVCWRFANGNNKHLLTLFILKMERNKNL